MQLMELKSFSVEDTMALAASFAAYLKPSDCILLAGDLGAGKTHFVKGLGRGLGVDCMITSPTFTIIKEYEGRLPLYHMDVYRVGEEADELGLEEYIEGSGVTVIEWAHLIQDLLPAHSFSFTIKKSSETERDILIQAQGSSHLRRLEEWMNDNVIRD
ncbi:tRNA (adenosine(37)-N6)-threonylcarbamoyltransferase complex ATPase subunit type 1 TsaE [Shouchella miscanthi]|uniref:tRNA (adenosine(37)-N6)-threonylcarbamoyltransferase complex ATPase subunit type 1 TsaE n=1 Tax=Shouchella miscanthi TaxID=2598861 RepID=UPI00119FEA9A